ncbi:MAG: HAD family hydrolase [Candidatus Bipolaricaulota bacterium]|nr:MAG: HAD family hydrolase [Candidatus Bipolaricaulota bacterium]
MDRIEAVFFDMGGTLETLWYDDALRRRASGLLHSFLVEHDLDPGVDPDVFYASITEGLSAYRAWNSSSLVELPALEICSRFILKDFGFAADSLRPLSEEFMLLLETEFYNRRVRPEAENVLVALRSAGLKLGLISNVMSRACVAVNLSRHGLLDHFDVVVASAAYGRRKPDPQIFLHAAREIGSPPDRCAHVGDKVSRDILGARRAGFGLAVLIEHAPVDGEEPTEPRPDAVIRDLHEIHDVLEPAEAAVPQANGDSGIRALFFDAGDILYFRPNRGAHIARFLRELPREDEASAVSEPKGAKDRAMRGEITKREYLALRLRALGVENELHLERGLEALEMEASDVAFFDRSRETLLELKNRGYLLGIITDTYHSKETKLGWLSRNGIAEVWDAFVSSHEEGVRKPDPAIYRAGLRRLGVTPHEAAFVGHKKAELDGAAAVGIRTVAFNYEADAMADEFIQRFDELLALFPSINGEERR